MIGYNLSTHFINQSDIKLIKTNPDLLTRVFPTVKVINCIFPFMIAFLVLLLLVKVIISVLVLRHSIENRFNFCK